MLVNTYQAWEEVSCKGNARAAEACTSSNQSGQRVSWFKRQFSLSDLSYCGYRIHSSAHGQGIMTYATGDKYVGEWRDNRQWLGTAYDKDHNATAIYSEGVDKPVN